MGLASSLNTALTGLTAAETQIDVLGNNLANAQTVGFKGSSVAFSTQFLQTFSVGSPPTSTNGGTNPRQAGLGVQVAGITPNFSQGIIQISANPSDLAIQGDGFFTVEGNQGERFFTRNGNFKLNSNNEIVTTSGNRLVGYGVDDRFELNTTEIVPLRIPLGTAAVAQATQVVTMGGELSSRGDIADTSHIAQSGILGNGRIPRPEALGITSQVISAPPSAGIAVGHGEGPGTHAEGATYGYRLVWLDAHGHESMPSDELTVTVPPGNGLADNVITLADLPAAGPEFPQLRIYRTEAGGSEYFRLADVAAGSTFVDDNTLPLSGTPLNNTGLTGNYSYMVTFFRNGEPESRPSVMLPPQSVINGRIMLDGLPVPPVPPEAGAFPAYDEVRIYRNTASDPSSFYLVGAAAPGGSFLDTKSDADISNLSIAGNRRIDLDGPRMNATTRLVDVVRREGTEFVQPFETGTLEFRYRKGERNQEPRFFEVTAETTVQELMNFMQDAAGIQAIGDDPANPIRASLNHLPGESGEIIPGLYVVNGQIRVVSNTGTENAVNFGSGSLRLVDDRGQSRSVNLAFASVQEARGDGASTDFVVYDSLGFPMRVRVTTVMEKRDNNTTVFRWFAESPDNLLAGGNRSAVGSGLVAFDGSGNFLSTTSDTVSILRDGFPSDSPAEFRIDFSNVSGLATAGSALAATRQDGSPPGNLTSYLISEDGRIRGIFSNGISRDLGQLQLARFSNPGGLDQRGNNLWAAGINSGLPIVGSPGQNGIGSIAAGALELSNSDIGKDLIQLVLASTQYRANSRLITATQQLFDELLNLRR
jgi:flagellar hook protein FlgE